MIEDAQHGGFQHLGLYHGTHDGNDWLVGESNLTFPHGVHVSGELHGAEVFPELPVLFPGKEFLIELLRFRAKMEDHLYHFLRTAHYGPVVILRGLAVEEVENCNLVLLAAFQIGLSHGVLVLVRHIGVVNYVHMAMTL